MSSQPDGTFEINYNDGSRITVLDQKKGGGVIFTTGNSQQAIRYNENDVMPEIVRAKFDQLPTILSHLQQREPEFSTSTPTYNPPLLSNRMYYFR